MNCPVIHSRLRADGPLPDRTGCYARCRAMTLVEMLVAMAITLVMMGAVAQVFGMLGQGVNGSRSLAELNDRMRATAYRLRQDLAGITVDPLPAVRPELNSGYLEILEGPDSDTVTYASGTRYEKWRGGADSSNGNKWKGNPEPYLSVVGSDDRIVGDTDDVLLFTTRSTGESFSGKADTRNSNLEGGSLRSPFAEVAWFCRLTPNTVDPRMYTLHRRQRLVMAHPGAEPFVDTTKTGTATNSFGGPPNTLPFSDWPTLFALTDVSCRRQGSVAIPNALGDLTRRENRFLHDAAFPHRFLTASPDITFSATSPRFGEDVILTNVIGFDVRVWDNGAVVQAVATGTTVADPRVGVTVGDPGYVVGQPGEQSGWYVDLGHGIDNIGLFCGLGEQKSGLRATTTSARTYCTWSTHYEMNAVDEDGVLGVDQGTNGVDDNGNNLIDEKAEQETTPPYPVALRGVEIRLRCYEPSSKQVRQITIRHDF